jgi:hypothetical protein
MLDKPTADFLSTRSPCLLILWDKSVRAAQWYAFPAGYCPSIPHSLPQDVFDRLQTKHPVPEHEGTRWKTYDTVEEANAALVAAVVDE